MLNNYFFRVSALLFLAVNCGSHAMKKGVGKRIVGTILPTNLTSTILELPKGLGENPTFFATTTSPRTTLIHYLNYPDGCKQGIYICWRLLQT
jgi:hypothetical protein